MTRKKTRPGPLRAERVV